jgi:hypothetical protein
LVDLAVRMVIDDPCENDRQIRERINVVQLTGGQFS